jgi:hypothetical protein
MFGLVVILAKSLPAGLAFDQHNWTAGVGLILGEVIGGNRDWGGIAEGSGLDREVLGANFRHGPSDLAAKAQSGYSSFLEAHGPEGPGI